MKGVTTTMPEAMPPRTVPKELLGPPGDFNPTLLMFFGALALIALSTLGYWRLDWPAWCCFCTNVLALHLAGTVIHDASHNVAHRDRVMNAILGHGSALMLGFAFPVFTRVHHQHHANVNDPENDPDHFVSTGGPLWLIAARFFYHEIFFFKRRLWRKYELLEWFLSRLFVATIVYVACQYDCLGYILNFWFSPALVVGLALGLFFDYLPHRPFTERRSLEKCSDLCQSHSQYPNLGTELPSDSPSLALDSLVLLPARLSGNPTPFRSQRIASVSGNLPGKRLLEFPVRCGSGDSLSSPSPWRSQTRKSLKKSPLTPDPGVGAVLSSYLGLGGAIALMAALLFLDPRSSFPFSPSPFPNGGKTQVRSKIFCMTQIGMINLCVG